MINGFDDLQKIGKDNVDVALKSADAFTKGFQALATETADYARQSLEAGAKAFEKLVAARASTRRSRSSPISSARPTRATSSQATKVGEIVTDMANDAYKPYEGFFGKFAEVGATAGIHRVEKGPASAGPFCVLRPAV